MAHKTYIRHASDGDTAILFIHGFLGSPEHFDRFIQTVPENFGIYNILLAGHGGSVRDFAKASMAIWKKQVNDAVFELLQKYQHIIIVAHSMGTFFAMDTAVHLPHRVRAVLLLQSPLKIAVKTSAVINTLKSFFNLIPPDDEVGKMFHEAHSVTLNKRIWEYIGWIPRYLELFSESRRARDTIQKVEVPCYICQSARDELIARRALDFIPNKPNIHVSILQNSEHFIYSNDDFLYMNKILCKLLEL